MTRWTQPLVRRNDWSTLAVPALGEWTPELSVTVVLPVWGMRDKVPYVLASLAAQSYPAHLIEVVVADDGNTPPVELPEVRPERTRVVRPESGWGKSNVSNWAVEVTDSDVVLLLDADMLVHRDHVEAHLRWHHEIDYAVVMGTKRFVDPAPLLERDPAAVRDDVAAGRFEELFDLASSAPHKWVEGAWRRTDLLTRAGARAFRVNVGATLSMRRALFDEVGRYEVGMVTGEDTELGYRLAEAGAVLVPDLRAETWHLGIPTVMRSRDELNRYNDAAMANLVPGMRAKRNRRGRLYELPYVEVVVPMDGDADRVIGCVDALLDSDLPDLEVLLVGEWSSVTDGRHAPLSDPLLDLRIVERTFRHDPRVHLVEEVPAGPCPAAYRLELASTQWAPVAPALLALLEDVERTHDAARRIVTGAETTDSLVAVLRATHAVQRARRVGADGTEQVDEVLAEAYGCAELTVEEAGWVRTAMREVPRLEGKLKPPMDPATSRRILDEALGRMPSEPAAGSADGDGDGPDAGQRHKRFGWLR